jgi:hypothetical protein
LVGKVQQCSWPIWQIEPGWQCLAVLGDKLFGARPILEPLPALEPQFVPGLHRVAKIFLCPPESVPIRPDGDALCLKRRRAEMTVRHRPPSKTIWGPTTFKGCGTEAWKHRTMRPSFARTR